MNPGFEALLARFGDAVELDLKEYTEGPLDAPPEATMSYRLPWRRTMKLLRDMQREMA